MKNKTTLPKEFTTIEYHKMLSRIIIKKKRRQPLMLKKFQGLKDFLISNWKIHE